MFVWLENGEVKITFQKELAPEGAIEIDTLGLNPVPPVEAFITIGNGQIIKKSQDEVLHWLKDTKLTELKTYVATKLAPTDYVVIRISEAETLGDTQTTKQLRQKYATQLQERQAIRQWSEQMKQAIRNAQTLDELRGIEIRYG